MKKNYKRYGALLKESTEGIPMSYRWNDIKYITIPNIIGKTKKEASKLRFTLTFLVVDGNVIVPYPLYPE